MKKETIGEIAAAAFCGVFSPEDAIRLAAARGRRMAALPPGGQMAVVFAGADVVGPRLGERCWIAGHHGPGETVISGDVADAMTRLEGLDVRPVVVDNAYHSPRVEPAARAFEADLAGFTLAPARLPAWGSNGARVEQLWQEPRYWRDHLVAPVRLADALAAAHADGVDCLVEVGARAVVLPTAGRQPDPIPVLVPTLRKDLPEREAWAVAAAELLVAGVDLPDLDPPSVRVDLPPRPRRGRRFAPPAPPPRVSTVAPTLGAVRWRPAWSGRRVRG